MDVSSDTQDNIQDDIHKIRLDSMGKNLSDVVQKIGKMRKSFHLFRCRFLEKNPFS